MGIVGISADGIDVGADGEVDVLGEMRDVWLMLLHCLYLEGNIIKYLSKDGWVEGITIINAAMS